MYWADSGEKSASGVFVSTITFSAASYIFKMVGYMMKRLSMKATPLMIWLGGACCTPRALRKSDKTTTIFKNEVRIITMKGSSDMMTKAVACVMMEGGRMVGPTTGAAACAPGLGVVGAVVVERGTWE